MNTAARAGRTEADGLGREEEAAQARAKAFRCVWGFFFLFQGLGGLGGILTFTLDIC